jgi:GntR family transcriptional regulator/MocR family aminotransferase
MRVRYRARRDAVTQALAAELPEAVIRGIAAGLHVTAELPATDDEVAIQRAAAERGIGIATMSDYGTSGGHPPTLILGYSQMSESRIRSGIHELASAVRASRR